MKKIYKKPTIASADYLLETVMQTGSPREAAGGPVDEGLPGQMGETDGTTDPFGGHGFWWRRKPSEAALRPRPLVIPNLHSLYI